MAQYQFVKFFTIASNVSFFGTNLFKISFIFNYFYIKCNNEVLCDCFSFIIYNFTAYCFLRPQNVIFHVNTIFSDHTKKFPHVFMHKPLQYKYNHEHKVSINFHFNNIFIFERIHRIPFNACLTKFELSNTTSVQIHHFIFF